MTAGREKANKMTDDLNGYDLHKITTLDGRYTYERPVHYEVRPTAFGGWWGVATFADGAVMKEFKRMPARQIPVPKERQSSEADERLIAAAPDLLAHLQTLVDGIAAGVAIPADGAAVAAARAVINQATGE